MRLVRLKLENWRGVTSREIEFAPGVTIVEGPNEAGKSSLIEALFTLIHELDSSNKQAIKAVQPVGEDVGSFVEAEIEAGEYRFVYAKTYNKNKSTSLKILAPKQEQLTGREAHERVNEILNETVDLDLWKALLVDQGEKIAPADLRDSEGLSRALDEAAGGAAEGHEDPLLFAAAQAEYEKYFTLKTGKPKKDLTDLESAYEEAERRFGEAKAALDAVEQETAEFERLEADIRRRNEELPKLKNSLARHEASKRDADRLKGELRLKIQRLESVREQRKNAERELEERKALSAQIDADEKALAEAQSVVEPIEARLAEHDMRMAQARKAVEARSASRKRAADALETAREDEAYIRNRAELARLEKRAADVEGVSRDLEAALETVGGIAIDEDGLRRLRQAEQNLSLATAKRDLAATAVRVTAETSLELDVAGESLSVEKGGTVERRVATDLAIRLPGVAKVEVSPPREALDLNQQLQAAEEALDRLLKKFDVASVKDAAESLARKQSAQQNVERLKARSADLLDGRSQEEFRQAVRTLEARCAAYAEKRESESPLPTDETEAADAIDAAKQSLTREVQSLEAAEANERELLKGREMIVKAQGDTQHRIVGLEATLKDRQTRIETARQQTADDALGVRAKGLEQSLQELQKAVATFQRKLDELSPDSIDTLYDNARAAVQRAERDLADAERRRAVLQDRLERAQADGRFESLDDAERRCGELREQRDAMQRRAGASLRLWETLNQHRDAARQAYVQPLKEAIERLGRIVFGNDFGIEISEYWTVDSRTLHEMVLPFSELSVGAKEQLGILTRLAAAQIVSRHGGVPLIIDDALGFSDPSRLETMGAAISAAGKNCQVVVLTCTPGRFSSVGNAAVVGL